MQTDNPPAPPTSDANTDANTDANDLQDIPPPSPQSVTLAQRLGAWWQRRAHSGRSVQKWLDRAVRYGLLALLVVGPIVMGGVHYEAGLALSGVGVLLGVVALAAHGGRIGAGPIGAALVLWVVLTAVQLLPLPAGLVEALQPQTSSHHVAARVLLGEDPSASMTLSLSPNRTAMALWHALGVCGVFVAAALSLQTWKRFAWFVPRLLVVGVVFGCAAVAQTVLFDGTVLGMMKPQAELATLWQGLLKTTLVCSNHAAALLGVISALALGVALSQQDAGRRGLLLTLYGALALGMCLTLSRGGILAWVCAHGLLWLMLRGDHVRHRKSMWAVVLAVVAMGAAAFLLGERYLRSTWDDTIGEWQNVERELDKRAESTLPSADAPPSADDPTINPPEPWLPSPQPTAADVSKILIYTDLKPMISDFRVAGIGRSAFVEVYPLYAGSRLPKTYSSAENEYLEFAAEYGVFAAALFFGLLAWGLGRVIARDWREQDRPLVAALAMGVGLLAVHNIVDFNLRVPAIGQLMGVMLGALCAREARYRAVLLKKTTSSTKGRLHLVWGWALTAALVGALLVALSHLEAARKGATSEDVQDLQQRAEALLQPGDGADKAARALLESANATIQARPVDGYASFLVGVGLANAGAAWQEKAMVWLDRARSLHHFDYRIELARGSVLGTLGRYDEAAAAFKAAAELDRGSMYAITAAIARTFTHMDHLTASLSSSPSDWLQLGKVLLDTQRYDEAVELAQRLQAAHPDEPAGLTLSYQAALHLGFSEAALADAHALVSKFGDDPSSYLMLYSAHLRQKPPNLASAYATLMEALKRHPKHTHLLQSQAQFLLGPGQALFPTPDDLPRWQQAIDEVMDAWRPAALANRQTRPAFYFLRGEYYRKLGNLKQALQAYQAALSAQPTHTPSQAAIFDVALRLTDLDLAFKALKDLSGRLPQATLDAMRQRIERCRAVLQRGHQLEFAPNGQCQAPSPSSAPPLRQKITEQQLLNPTSPK